MTLQDAPIGAVANARRSRERPANATAASEPARPGDARPANRRSLPYRPAYDGLRGLGVLAIMWGHLGHADGAIYAIDAFFLLSGYLITGVLLSQWESTWCATSPDRGSRASASRTPSASGARTVWW